MILPLLCAPIVANHAMTHRTPLPKQGTAKAKSARLVGPGERSVDFDLEMEAKVDGGGTVSDRSELTFVMDAQTGEIETGKRYARPGGAASSRLS